jgi:flagellar motility protein MotE (MotC chaperone)
VRWFIIGVVALVMASVMAVAVLDHYEFLDAGALVLAGLKKVKAVRPYVRTYELGLARSQALAREETRLSEARQAVEIKAQQLAKQEADLEERRRATEEEVAALEARREGLLKQMEGTQQLDRLAKLCGAMTTAGALRLLSELGEAEVAQVLARLPEKQAGAILAGLEPKRAARVVTRLIRQ